MILKKLLSLKKGQIVLRLLQHMDYISRKIFTRINVKNIAECEKDLQPGDLGCVVYDVDGVVVFRPPQRVPIIQAN